MPRTISVVWKAEFPGLRQALTQTIDAAVNRDNTEARVFFRADDIDDADDMFVRMMALFMRFEVPLALAVVPAWLTEAKWDRLLEACGRHSELWCWHQHGWQHANHEPVGKKQEFGPARSFGAIREDLVRGQARLAGMMGDAFCPVFTPPWNRCSQQALQGLVECGFAAVSRFRGADPAAPSGLPDLQVHVDLHTRKEADAASARKSLMDEMQTALSAGRCGFMLHHHRMNGQALVFLECLLQTVADHPRLKLIGFKELIDEKVGRGPAQSVEKA